MTVRIAICDDEAYILEQLAAGIEAFFTQKGVPLSVTCFTDGEALLAAGAAWDIVFLDVRMAPMDGLTVAKALRRNGFAGFLLFVTIMRERVFDAFAVQAFDYLVKPLQEADFTRTMDRLWQKVQDGQAQWLLIQKSGDWQMIPFDRIVYCEVINRKVYLHLADKTVVDYYDKLSALEQKLDSRFFKCHRSYLINLNHLQSFQSGTAYLAGGEKVAVSRLRQEALFAAAMQHIGQGGVGKW